MVGEERGGEDTGGGGRSFLSNIKFCRMKAKETGIKVKALARH